MTVNDILIRVRQLLNDMGKDRLSDEELIYALNNAMDKASLEYADRHLPDLISTFTVTGATGVQRPDNFINYLGQYPLENYTDSSTNKVMVKHLDPNYTGTMEVRYYAMRANVNALTDTIPFYQQYQLRDLVMLTAQEIDPQIGQPPQQSKSNNE